MTTKPGYKTTEFWLTLLATLVGLLLSSGVLGTGTQWEAIAGVIASSLAALGYAGSRATTKQAASDAASSFTFAPPPK
jgi:hypothetical protein